LPLEAGAFEDDAQGKETSMYEDRLSDFDDEIPATSHPDQGFDFDVDPVDVRGEVDTDGPLEDEGWEDQESRIENADLDNATDEFVDLANGRDLDGLSDLLAADVTAEFLGGMSRQEVVDGFGDLFLRYPTLLTTRADLGSEPIIALWTFDHETDHFDQFGFLFFELSESADGLVDRITYAEEVPDTEDLVIEIPDRGDLPEWEEWAELDED
jgi:hypothetical protein